MQNSADHNVFFRIKHTHSEHTATLFFLPELIRAGLLITLKYTVLLSSLDHSACVDSWLSISHVHEPCRHAWNRFYLGFTILSTVVSANSFCVFLLFVSMNSQLIPHSVHKVFCFFLTHSSPHTNTRANLESSSWNLAPHTTSTNLTTQCCKFRPSRSRFLFFCVRFRKKTRFRRRRRNIPTGHVPRKSARFAAAQHSTECLICVRTPRRIKIEAVQIVAATWSSRTCAWYSSS